MVRLDFMIKFITKAKNNFADPVSTTQMATTYSSLSHGIM